MYIIVYVCKYIYIFTNRPLITVYLTIIRFMTVNLPIIIHKIWMNHNDHWNVGIGYGESSPNGPTLQICFILYNSAIDMGMCQHLYSNPIFLEMNIYLPPIFHVHLFGTGF